MGLIVQSDTLIGIKESLRKPMSNLLVLWYEEGLCSTAPAVYELFSDTEFQRDTCNMVIQLANAHSILCCRGFGTCIKWIRHLRFSCHLAQYHKYLTLGTPLSKKYVNWIEQEIVKRGILCG